MIGTFANHTHHATTPTDRTNAVVGLGTREMDGGRAHCLHVPDQVTLLTAVSQSTPRRSHQVRVSSYPVTQDSNQCQLLEPRANPTAPPIPALSTNHAPSATVRIIASNAREINSCRPIIEDHLCSLPSRHTCCNILIVVVLLRPQRDDSGV